MSIDQVGLGEAVAMPADSYVESATFFITSSVDDQSTRKGTVHASGSQEVPIEVRRKLEVVGGRLHPVNL